MKFKHLCEAKDFRLKALVTDLETKKRKVITFDIEANDNWLRVRNEMGFLVDSRGYNFI